MFRLTWVGSFLVGVWLVAPGAAGGGGVGAAAVLAGEAGTATGGTGGGAGAGEVGTTTGGTRSKIISTYFKIHFFHKETDGFSRKLRAYRVFHGKVR